MTKTSTRYSPEVRERAVRLVLDHQKDHPSQWAAIQSIAPKIGCSSETLRKWVRRSERDAGRRAGPTSDDVACLKALERENRELRQAKEILAQGIRVFRPGGARPPHEEMKMFIDEHRDAYGVEPICRVLPIAPSTYRAHAARRADPSLLSERARRDAELRPEIRRVWHENFEVYGVRKVWRQLNREGVAVARCTVARLMAAMGLAGAVRGKPVKTTVSNAATPCPENRVNRQFHAPRPNALWLSDFSYVATWAGFIYVAFVIDVFPVCRAIGPKIRLAMPDLRRDAAAGRGCSSDRWLACLPFDAGRVRSRCARAGAA